MLAGVKLPREPQGSSSSEHDDLDRRQRSSVFAAMTRDLANRVRRRLPHRPGIISPRSARRTDWLRPSATTRWR